MNPNDVIDGIEALIRERGWFQGDFEGPDGSVCIIGAAELVEVGDMRTRYEAMNRIGYAVRRQHPGSGWIANFNDNIATSVEDVYLMLKKAKESDPTEAA